MADLTPSDQEAIVSQIKTRFDYASREWADIRKEGRTDIRFVSGDCWDPKDRKARADAGRPVISPDQLGQYVNQLINEVRQHKRAIKVTAIGDGQSKAKEARARLRANLIRQVEYRCNAQTAYTTMFENAVQRSYGFLRVKARYEHPRSFYQELIIEPFQNPDMVTPDPDDLSPVGADMKFAFVHEWWSIPEFHRRWPKAKVRGRSVEHEKDAPKWWNGDRIQIAEYWAIEPEERELLHLQTETGLLAMFTDELTPPADDANPEVQRRWVQRFGRISDDYMRGVARVVNRRTVEYPCVYEYRTNGIELLEPDPEGQPGKLKVKWLGTSIPIIACYGKTLWVSNDGDAQRSAGEVTSADEGVGSRRKILSLIRLARDPQMLYAYYRTCQAELVGMTPKTPFIGYVGQFRTRTKDWQAINHEPKAYLEADPMTEATGANVLPLPQRQPYDPPVERLEVGAESARRDIQAATGTMPLPTSAQRQNEKSGIALERIKTTSQQGSFHFVDHYEMAITRTGAILDELLPYYYDAARDVTVRTPSDATQTVRINDPQAIDEESGEPLMLRPEDIHDVTLSTGPSQDSEREAQQDFVDTVVANLQSVAQIAGPQQAAKILALSIKLKNLGPIGDEMAGIVDPMSANKTSREQLMAQLQEAQQLLETLTGELKAKTEYIQTDQVKAQQQVELAQAKAEADAQMKMAELATKERLELRKLEVQLEIEMAKLGSAEAMARAKIEQEQLHAHGDALLKEQELETQTAQADMDRQSERDEKEADRAFQADQAEKAAQREASQPDA